MAVGTGGLQQEQATGHGCLQGPMGLGPGLEGQPQRLFLSCRFSEGSLTSTAHSWIFLAFPTAVRASRKPRFPFFQSGKTPCLLCPAAAGPTTTITLAMRWGGQTKAFSQQILHDSRLLTHPLSHLVQVMGQDIPHGLHFSRGELVITPVPTVPVNKKSLNTILSRLNALVIKWSMICFQH